MNMPPSSLIIRVCMTINNLSRHFLQEHPRESAKVLENFPADELVPYFAIHEDDLVANVLRYFLPGSAVGCLLDMEPQRAAEILEQLGVDTAARLLRRMNVRDQATLLGAVSAGFAYRLRTILRYPAGTVGQYMSPNVFTAADTMLASDLIKSARTTTTELQGDIFITGDAQRLVGLIDVKNLVLADPTVEVSKLMHIPDLVLNARTNLDYVKDHPKWRFKEILPVVDHNNVFVGVLKRSIMFDALAGDQNLERVEETFMDTVMQVADLFWDICTDIVLPKSDNRPEERTHERK
jgi:magnesium transporter